MNSVKNKKTCAETVAGLFSTKKRGADDARGCSLVVGGARIPVQCEAGKVTVADHGCLDDWASEWTSRKLPRIAPFDLASGALENGDSRPIVEIHNKADGNCLLYALGLYLCAAGVRSTVGGLRKQLLEHVERRVRDPSLDSYAKDMTTLRGTRYGKEDQKAWERHAAQENLDVKDDVEKYMFVHRREDVDLGELEIEAFSRVYNRDVCSWFNGSLGFMMVHRSLSDNLDFPGRILDFDTCVHLYYYEDPGHYTLLALLDSGVPGFGRRYV
jgi:hypothetical protein